jgi:hypothetical protein
MIALREGAWRMTAAALRVVDVAQPGHLPGQPLILQEVNELAAQWVQELARPACSTARLARPSESCGRAANVIARRKSCAAWEQAGVSRRQ